MTGLVGLALVLMMAVGCGATAPAVTPASTPSATVVAGKAGEVQYITITELFSDPEQYKGTDILLEGFYFHGWETIVLSERLEPTGFAEGHLWPRGQMVWIEGDVPREVYDQLYQQDMMIGPLERYGKLRIRGRYEHGGRYGHAGGFTAQIVLSDVELLQWSPVLQQPDYSITDLK